MNTTFAIALATNLATLTRVVNPSTDALRYGLDLSCVSDLSPTLAEVDPASPSAIVEAVIRRFTTPRGALEDDQDYGQDVRAACNRGVTARDLRALSGVLRGEAQKDDRVALANVTLQAAVNSRELSIQVFITPADPRLQDFAFTFAVTDSQVLMVTING